MYNHLESLPKDRLNDLRAFIAAHSQSGLFITAKEDSYSLVITYKNKELLEDKYKALQCFPSKIKSEEFHQIKGHLTISDKAFEEHNFELFQQRLATYESKRKMIEALLSLKKIKGVKKYEFSFVSHELIRPEKDNYWTGLIYLRGLGFKLPEVFALFYGTEEEKELYFLELLNEQKRRSLRKKSKLKSLVLRPFLKSSARMSVKI